MTPQPTTPDKTTFEDTAGRTWRIPFTFHEARKLKKEMGLDLLTDTKNSLQQIGSDPWRLLDVVWLLIKPQADNNGVTLDDWAAALDTAAISAATDALMAAYIFFSRRLTPRTAEALEAAYFGAKNRLLKTRESAGTLNAAELAAKLDELMDPTAGQSEPDLPASSA